MARVLVIHWRPEEAEDGLALLRKAGHGVEVFSDQGGKGLSRFRKEPPEVVLVSLERLPSHSRHFAQWFRTGKGTEHLPIVFVGGKEDKVAPAREMLPDAVFCTWRTVRGAVTKALKTPQTAVPPAQMSDKPLWKRLEVRAGDRVLQVGGPDDLHALLGDDLPAGVALERVDEDEDIDGREAELVLLFVTWLRDLQRHFPAAAAITPARRPIWLCWPKKSSGVDTNVTPAAMMAYAKASGWSHLKVSRVDDTWAGHLYRRRRK